MLTAHDLERLDDPATDAPPSVLARYYDATDAGDSWHMRCKVCRRGWSSHKDTASRAGNVLHLLSHAFGHAENLQGR